MLGCWLLVSPWIFGHYPQQQAFVINDFACAVAVMAFGFLSFWRPLRHIHLLTILVAGWMIAFAYLNRAEPVPPPLQNNVLTALLLMMFAVLPNHASQPPEAWQTARRKSLEVQLDTGETTRRTS